MDNPKKAEKEWFCKQHPIIASVLVLVGLLGILYSMIEPWYYSEANVRWARGYAKEKLIIKNRTNLFDLKTIPELLSLINKIENTAAKEETPVFLASSYAEEISESSDKFDLYVYCEKMYGPGVPIHQYVKEYYNDPVRADFYLDIKNCLEAAVNYANENNLSIKSSWCTDDIVMYYADYCHTTNIAEQKKCIELILKYILVSDLDCWDLDTCITSCTDLLVRNTGIMNDEIIRMLSQSTLLFESKFKELHHDYVAEMLNDANSLRATYRVGDFYDNWEKSIKYRIREKNLYKIFVDLNTSNSDFTETISKCRKIISVYGPESMEGDLAIGKMRNVWWALRTIYRARIMVAIYNGWALPKDYTSGGRDDLVPVVENGYVLGFGTKGDIEFRKHSGVSGEHIFWIHGYKDFETGKVYFARKVPYTAK